MQLVTEEHYAVFDCLNNQNACALSILKDPEFDMVITDPWDNTPLMSAITSGMAQALALLLNAKSPSMPIRDYINMAKPTGHNAVIYAASIKDVVILKSLLKRGGDPNSRLSGEKGGWTAMHFAASLGSNFGGHLKMMLEYGGDPYAVTADGRSILEVCDPTPVSWRHKVVDILNDAIDAMDEAESAAIGQAEL